MILLIDKEDIQAYKQFSPHTPPARYEPYIIEAQEFDLKRALGSPLYTSLLQNIYTEAFTMTVSTVVGAFTVGNVITGKVGSTIVATGTITAVNSLVYTVTKLSGDWRTATSIELSAPTNTATIVSMAFGKYHKLFYGQEYVDSYQYPVIYNGIIPALVYWVYGRFYSNQRGTATPTGTSTKTNQFSQPEELEEVSKKVTSAFSGANAYFSDVRKYICDMNIADPDTYPFQYKAKEPIISGAAFTTVDRERTRKY